MHLAQYYTKLLKANEKQNDAKREIMDTVRDLRERYPTEKRELAIDATAKQVMRWIDRKFMKEEHGLD